MFFEICEHRDRTTDI